MMILNNGGRGCDDNDAADNNSWTFLILLLINFINLKIILKMLKPA